VITLPSGEIASGGDDCTVRIWNVETGKCVQEIKLAKTVWSLASNSLGDIIVGCEDHKMRIFTRD
jgi:phospholipase A-2-activating protein